MVRKCVQCGKEFHLTQSEVEFYQSKGLEVPKRCEACRKQNKEQKQKQDDNVQHTSHTSQKQDNIGQQENSSYQDRSKHMRKKPLAVLAAIIIFALFFFFDIDVSQFINLTQVTTPSIEQDTVQGVTYQFKNTTYLEDHFAKHKKEFDYVTAEQYLQGANDVINNPNALHKIEEEDGDDVYYVEATNELVIVSTEGYIRTYFKPSAGIEYFNRT